MEPISVNPAGLDQQVTLFNEEMSDRRIEYSNSCLHNCTGDAIYQINACLALYDVLCCDINDLYSATSDYLNKANYNINLCEVDNTST